MLKVAEDGTPSALLGEGLAAGHGLGSGIYELNTGPGPQFQTCAIVVTPFAGGGNSFTAQASASGDEILVHTYKEGTPADVAFSMIISC